MGVFRIFRPFTEPIRKIPKWIDYDGLKYTANSMGKLVKRLFVPAKQQGSAESFADAVARLQLSEADLQAKQRQFLWLAACYALGGVALGLYAVYLFFHGHLTGALAAFGVTCCILAFSFRHHFWYTQMKCRRLGMSFKEWQQTLFQRGSINNDNNEKH